jgi:hypothetical protein
MKKRRGYIKIDAEFLRNETELLLNVFAKFVPVKIDYNEFYQEFTYLGSSPFFDEINEGDVYPTYTIIVYENHDKGTINIEFKRQ